MGCIFLRTLQIQGQEKLGMVSTRPESRTGFYIRPMGVGCQGSSLVSSSGILAFLWHQKFRPSKQNKTKKNPGSMWQAAGWRFLCKAMVMAHQS